MQHNVRIGRPYDEPIADSFLQGVKDCVPTLLGYLSIGFAAGAVGYTAGLSIVEVTLMSLLVYAGSAQFIIAGMVAAGGSAMAIILTVFIVNLRHLLLSAALSPYFRRLPAAKAMLIGSLLTDETFGVAIHRGTIRGSLGAKWMNGLNVAAYLNWLLATVAGAFFGKWIEHPQQWGLDFALAAMFIGLLVLQMGSRGKIFKDLFVALTAIAAVCAASLVVSGSLAVIAATVIAASVGAVLDKWK